MQRAMYVVGMVGLVTVAACDRSSPATSVDASPTTADAALAWVDAARPDPLARPWTLLSVTDEDPAIHKALKVHAPELRKACAADAGAQAVVHLRLGSNGKLLRATVADGDPALGACYARELARVTPFLPPKGEEYEASVKVPVAD